jgi:hypothetical protein
MSCSSPHQASATVETRRAMADASSPIHYHTINRADLVKNVWRLPARMVWSTE